MNILLTGSTGFLGNYILNELSSKHEVFTLNRRTGNYIIDLSQSTVFFEHNFELVIHSAGLAHNFKANCINYYETNVKGTINLLKSFSINNIPKKFVFISSVSVYGIIAGEIISETTPLLATDPYGKSKIEAESIVKTWCEEHNVICTILRLPLVVGENPPGNLAAMIRGINKGYYFNIAGGNAKKSMVLASDIASFILKAAEVGGTYNLTDGIHPTFNELSRSISLNLEKSFVPNMPFFIAKVLAKIGDLFGNTFPINSNKLVKITSTLTFDDTKARIAFGWKATPVLESFKLNEDA